MKVTRVVVHENKAKKGKPLFLCSVILDDCLMLSDIRLYSGEKGYYLCLPSKQDVFREVRDMNPETHVVFPEIEYKDAECTCRKYDEFYHPVEQEFYYSLLDTVVYAYEVWEKTGRQSIKLKNRQKEAY